jgi:hypothetical protein
MDFKLTAALGFLVLGIIFGVWLAHAGKPLNTPLLTVHKLMALAAVVLGVWAYGQWQKGAVAGGLTLGLLVVTGVLVLVLFATGAALSQNKPDTTALQAVHRAATLLALVCTGLALWSLKK